MPSNESATVPQTQNAAVGKGSGADTKVSVESIPVTQPAPHQILVKINWSGLCASDKCLLRDEWSAFGKMVPPMAASARGIAGHEGAGVVVAVGEEVSNLWKVGDRAGVKWIESTCGVCEMCSNGLDEVHCLSAVHHAVEVAGTFQEYCVTDGSYATRIPEGVTDEEAGPIMCGGFSAYAACKRSAVRPGQWIVILGGGGGVGHFALQYAKAMGMRVIAVDGGKEKEQMCRKLGAEEFIDYRECKNTAAEVMRITTYGAHGALVAAPTQEAYATAPLMLRPRGTMVALALPKDPSIIAGMSAVLVSGLRLNIVGSLVGTKKEADEALDFTVRGLVHPVLTKGTLQDVDKFCDLLAAGKIPGRVVLKVSS
ncbi:alcohol dehydrogenase [Ilyonectria destructans]|nr:alcohol dehydrogenase [Ilyonectria destructans]